MRGIYAGAIVRSDGAELMYVGQAQDIPARWREHLKQLRVHRHHDRPTNGPDFFLDLAT
jgi:hypothetical protein